MVFPHQLCLAQHQALHRLFYFLPASAWFEIQLSLERVELEKIAMRFARRRTRTVVSDPAKVVATLPLAARKFVNPGNALGQTGRGPWWVEQHPVSPGSVRRVRIVSDESEGTVPGGGSVQESSGETSAPSQVNFLG